MKKITPLILAALCLVACATVAPYQGDPTLSMTPQTIMAAKPCSPLPMDHFSQWNPGPMGGGWTSKTPPAGMQPLSCGNRYLDSLYCHDKTRCVGATWGTNTPARMDSATVTWVVDVLQGAVAGCAQLSDRFGLAGKLDCTRQVCAATGSMPTRCTWKVEVKGQAQPQGATQVIFDAVENDTVVGAIGTTTAMN